MSLTLSPDSGLSCFPRNYASDVFLFVPMHNNSLGNSTRNEKQEKIPFDMVSKHRTHTESVNINCGYIHWTFASFERAQIRDYNVMLNAKPYYTHMSSPFWYMGNYLQKPLSSLKIQRVNVFGFVQRVQRTNKPRVRILCDSKTF